VLPTLEAIAAIADVMVQLEVELDRKTMRMGEILEMEKGCVVKMTRSAGENIDIVIGGALLGFGEIVIIEDTMGVRITDFRAES
jgi:flagellar motor switch protein FliN